ncbi:MAG: holo-ACP synthase [Bacillus sp. (in: firmicutes)]
MIKGIGIDIVEIGRVKQLALSQPKFSKRILTEAEHQVFDALKEERSHEYLAGRFAAKEAFAKALGTGIGQTISFRDIEVLKDDLGKPFINKPFRQGVHLSISHSSQYAVAQVIIEEVQMCQP